MKNKMLLILLIALLSIAACNNDKQETKSEVTTQDINKELAFNKPSDNHRALNAFVGRWVTTWKIWDKPTEEPTWTTKGKVTFQWVMKGRFLQGNFTGQMMNMPYEGQFTIGYDAYEKHGSAIADSKNNFNGLKLIGKSSSGPVDQKNTTYLYDMRLVIAEKMIEETWSKDNSGKQAKVLEITYETEALQTLSLSQVTLYVNDSNEAVGYYSDKLGFSVTADDDKTIPGFRYLEIGYNQPNGTRTVLVKAETDDDRKKVGRSGTIVLNTTDFESTYKKMKENRVFLLANRRPSLGVNQQCLRIFTATLSTWWNIIVSYAE